MASEATPESEPALPSPAKVRERPNIGHVPTGAKNRESAHGHSGHSTTDQLAPTLPGPRVQAAASHRPAHFSRLAQTPSAYAEPVPEMAVGEWILEARVGRGATGEVWRARHSVWSERVVAVKFATNPEYLAAIRNDGLIRADLSQLDSPHLVKVLGLNVLANPPYLLMEYVAGATLRDRLRDSRRLLPSEALRILEGVLKGLAIAHNLGVVHRDLKPENVLLDLDGTARLTDFSVAASVVGEASLRHSLGTDDLAAQSIAGTLVYMAPEQRQGVLADTRSDIYSLGVLLFEMLTGELPQPGDKIADYVPGVPAGIEELFERCFTRPERRFGNARVMLDFVQTLGKDGVRQRSPAPASVSLPPSAVRKMGKARPVLSTRDMAARGVHPEPETEAPRVAGLPPILSTRDLAIRRSARAFEEAGGRGAVARQPDEFQKSTAPKGAAASSPDTVRPTGVDDLERLLDELPEDNAETPSPELIRSVQSVLETKRAAMPPLRALYRQNELATAMAAYANGEYRKAVDEFRKVVENKPENVTARRGLAMSLYLSGRPKQALAIYGGLVQRREDSAEVWNNIGVISLALGRVREAERALLRAIELKPRYAPAFSNLAGVYQRLGKPDLARAHAKTALEIDPENLAASFNLTM